MENDFACLTLQDVAFLLEDHRPAAVPEGQVPIQAEITFRLMKETSETINKTKAVTLARGVKSAFGATTSTYQFPKGKMRASYYDPANGYRMSFNVQSETKAQEVIKKILSIQDHTFDGKKFSYKDTPLKNSINNPVETNMVYGQSIKERRWRPTGNVRFRWATLMVYGRDRDVVLYDPFGVFPEGDVLNVAAA